MTGRRGVTVSVSREQVLAFRRAVSALDERLPYTPESMRRAAWAGLQDSMPRAALLSIHARVANARPDSWADPALVQVWGPRFSAFVVPADDHALFTVGRHPDDARGRRRAEEMAALAADYLGKRTLTDREVASAHRVGNAIRYATTTGTLLIRWEGARAPRIWVVPRPEIEPLEARVELARRYIHVFGPTTAASFARWAGIGAKQGVGAFDMLGVELIPVRTPIGAALALEADEETLRSKPGPAAAARLLPSGDPFWLFWGDERDLLVPDARRRDELWTPRVWPGALLVNGDLAGVWRRAGAKVEIDPWRRLSAAEIEAVEAEAAALPLPDLKGPIRVSWGAALSRSPRATP